MANSKKVQVVPALIAALDADLDTLVGNRVEEALVRIGIPAVEPLIAALKGKNGKGKDGFFQWRAARVLGQIGDDRAVEPLIAVLKNHPVYEVRSTMVKLLVRIGAPAVEPLIAALKGKDDYVQRAAAEALEEIGDAQAVEPLIEALKDESWEVCLVAATALGKIGDARAVEPLVEVLKNPNAAVRKSAVVILESLGWRPRDSTERALRAVALRQWDEVASLGAAAVEPLRRAEDDIWHAAKTIEEIRDVQAVEPLIEALQDGSWTMRLAAARALGGIADPRAVGPLMRLVIDTYVGRPYNPNVIQGDIHENGTIIETLVEGLERLLKPYVAANVAPDDLRTLAHLEDVDYVVEVSVYGSDPYDYRGQVHLYDTNETRRFDCSKVRQLALRELVWRGLAP